MWSAFNFPRCNGPAELKKWHGLHQPDNGISGIQHPNERQAFEKVWPSGDSDGVFRPSLVSVQETRRRKIGA